MRREFHWNRHFDCLVFSHEVHLVKLEAAIYEHCLRTLGTTALETLFIDDREVNVKAAQRLGIRVLRFESVEQLRGELEDMGFPILPSASVRASVQCAWHLSIGSEESPARGPEIGETPFATQASLAGRGRSGLSSWSNRAIIRTLLSARSR